MKLLLSWLDDFIKIKDTPKVLASKLASIGFEVEDLYNVGAMDFVVLGKIVDIKTHPNADRLVVCDIDIGQKRLTIVTGATNVHVNDYIPVALDGAVLPNGKAIKVGELRGVSSQGMLCSPDELKLEDNYKDDGILILGNGKFEYALGTAMSTVFGLDDYVLDIAVPANRPDCQSVIGLAREIATLYDKQIKEPALDYKLAKSTTKAPTVTVDYTLCNRYQGQVVEDIKVVPSPDLIASRLTKVGISVRNSIVDITNYVLIELGQPLHAFDYLSLPSSDIAVRAFGEADKLVALNDKPYTLSSDTVAITSSDQLLAIAGIIGGKDSAISDNTEKVFLESAIFVRAKIRHSSKKLGLRTDSSSRYEKGMYFDSPDFGLKRALHLIDKYGFGKICQNGFIDKFDAKPKQDKTTTTTHAINALLGITVPTKTIVKILTGLGFDIQQKDNVLDIAIPNFRTDIQDYTDIAEEIIRFYGYDKLHATHSFGNGGIGDSGLAHNAKQRVAALLNAYGYNEIITNSFIDSADQTKLGLKNDTVVTIKNPLNAQQDTMRTQMVSSMLHTTKTNLNRKNKQIKIFEFGRVYFDFDNEVETLCIATTSDDIYQLKAICQKIFDGIDLKFERSKISHYNPYASMDIYRERTCIGVLGHLHPLVLDNFGIEQTVIVAELFVDDLLKTPPHNIKVVPISKHPIVERDLSIVIKDDIAVGDVIATAQKASKLNSQITLQDIYKGQQIAAQDKSVMIKIELVEDKTLAEQEIALCIADIVKALQDKFDAKLRN